MNVTAVARLPHRLLTAFLLALVLWPMVSVGPAEAAVYVVKQCNPATTYEHDWLAPTDRPDAFWAEARCWEGSLNLNAWPIKSVWNGNGISWIAFAPDGTTFAQWEAGFQGHPNSSDGVLIRGRVCWDYLCGNPGPDLFFGLWSGSSPINYGWKGSGALALRLELLCTGWGGDDGCGWGVFGPGVAMRDQTVYLDDGYAPYVPSLSGGSLAAGGWQAGNGTVAFSAGDYGGGVASAELWAGGQLIGREATCSGPINLDGQAVWPRFRPCPGSVDGTIGASLNLPDGVHQAQLFVRDPAGQATGSHQFPIRVDNTPPAPPSSVSVDGGDGWRNTNRFALGWENPVERHAPIAAANWRLCPVAGGACTAGRSAGRDVNRLESLVASTPGEHDLSIWLEDEAGNADPGRPRTVRLRLDTEAPRVAFEPHDPADPQRVSALVTDDNSGLAAGEIEMRAAGGSTWHTLATDVEGSRLVALVDDERFRDGNYEFRARAVDAAGNESSTDRRADGARMSLILPLRIETRLRAGVPRATRHGRKRGRRLAALARVRYGRSVELRGRLTNRDGQPIDGATITVFSKGRFDTGDFGVAGITYTDRNGRFRYRARADRSRLLRFRYTGSRRIAGRSADVVLAVPATSTIFASKRLLHLGSAVKFSGRIRTRPVPATGKLVEIQAYFRGRWRTISTVRSDARGRWHYRYRFSGTVGRVRYRFRAMFPYESGYGFDAGASPATAVTVIGL